MKALISSLIVLALTACSSLDRGPAASKDVKIVPVSQADLDQVYLEAQLYIFSGNLEKAKSVLDFAIKTKPPAVSAVEFERMLARVEASSGQTEEAFKRLTSLSSRFPENVSVLSDTAQFLYGIQFKEQAYEMYSKLTRLAPEHSNYWIYKGLLALELSQVEVAWESFDHLIKKTSDAKHLGHLYMGKLFQMTNFSKKAEKQFRLCLTVEDGAKECALELAAHMQKLGRPDEAFKFLESYIASHELKSSIPVLKKLLEWSLNSGNEERTSHYVEILERLRPSDMNLKRRAALIFVERKEFKSAKERMNIVVENEESNVQDLSNYLHILTLMEDEKEKIVFFDKVIKTKKLNEQIFFEKFKSDKNRFGQKKAEAVLKKSCDFQKVNKAPCAYVYSYILLENGKVKKARRNLEKLVGSDTMLGMLKPKYFLSQIYLKEGLRDKSMKVLDEILSENEVYAPALNFKAYTLLQKDESLKEAEALSLRALAVQPQNGHYLDTYGWILYKKGLFKESVAVLQQAQQVKPGEPEIAEHLADAFAALGDKAKAVKFYELASGLFKGENVTRVDEKLANIQKLQRSIGSVPD